MKYSFVIQGSSSDLCKNHMAFIEKEPLKTKSTIEWVEEN
jgi:hypothetical protein